MKILHFIIFIADYRFRIGSLIFIADPRSRILLFYRGSIEDPDPVPDKKNVNNVNICNMYAIIFKFKFIS
jgi:hypothetical protein